MIFQEKCFSYYILLTGLILLSDWLYFSRYWEIGASQLFVNQAVKSKNLNLIFSTLKLFPFCYMTKKSRRKLKYLENEKNFFDEIKSIF